MEHFTAWRQARPGERVLNVDIPLSYSIFDVKVRDIDYDDTHADGIMF